MNNMFENFDYADSPDISNSKRSFLPHKLSLVPRLMAVSSNSGNLGRECKSDYRCDYASTAVLENCL